MIMMIILKLKKVFLFAMFVILFVLSCKKNEYTLLDDMANLDREYIETLLVAKTMDAENTKKTLTNFINYYEGFKKKYYNINKEDREWKNDFDSLKDILIRASYYITSGDDVSASYLILHDAKYVLSDMRKRNNIDWFFDHLSAIYKTAYRMQEISKVYASNLGELSDAEKIRLESVFNLLDAACRKAIFNIEKSGINYFNLPDKKVSILIQNTKAIDSIVSDIGREISKKNYKYLTEYSEAIISIYFNTIAIISEN